MLRMLALVFVSRLGHGQTEAARSIGQRVFFSRSPPLEGHAPLRVLLPPRQHPPQDTLGGNEKDSTNEGMLKPGMQQRTRSRASMQYVAMEAEYEAASKCKATAVCESA